jgi:hypothetical protein
VVDALLAALVAAPAGWPFPFPPVAAVLGALAVAYVAYVLAAPTSE